MAILYSPSQLGNKGIISKWNINSIIHQIADFIFNEDNNAAIHTSELFLLDWQFG